MFQKGNRTNPGGQSTEALSGIRHFRRLLAGSLKGITLQEIESLYRDKDGNIIRTWFLEYLKLVTHYWPDGFVDPDAKSVDKSVTIRVEVVAPIGKATSRKADSGPAVLVDSTLKVER